MNETNRRKFLQRLGLTVGGIAIGKEFATALPGFFQEKKVKPFVPTPAPEAVVDFRYAPKFWQSTYCLPDDPYKSLVGKNGELLCNHPGTSGGIKDFAEIVSVGIKGETDGVYLGQTMESPAIPIIHTKLGWTNVDVHLTSCATNRKDEGRVDNLLIEIVPKGNAEIECTPEIIISSKKDFLLNTDGNGKEVHFDSSTGAIFLMASSKMTESGSSPLRRYELKPGTAKSDKPLRYVVRLPQSGQPADKIEDGLDEFEKLLEETRKFWSAWKPYDGKVSWNLPKELGNFYTAAVRNMVESREIKDGRRIFQVGPTVYRDSWLIDGTFLLEAARYAGYDKEAQEGLQTIWDRQKDDGSFSGGAGEAHWKDTAAAIYMLIRQAELSQDWTYFNELYPDAMRAMKYLVSLRDKAAGDATLNGQYTLLPQGFGDSGIGGIRSEYTNSLWTLIMLRAFLEIAEKLQLQRQADIRSFYTDMRQAFFTSVKTEQRKHPNGFTYLPMLMKDDPKWSEKDERKQPRPQAAQIYMTQAIYPGQFFARDHPLVNMHLSLMKAVVKEDIPAETGWMADKGVWSYNAAVVAQMYLYVGQPDWARKTFIGFLNHASPLLAWREEQSLQSVPDPSYVGDMPHNWASAECIRYLRHMMILEELNALRLLEGLGEGDLKPQLPYKLAYSPTRFGRITLELEPLDAKRWQVTFRREDMNPKIQFDLKQVQLPVRLPGNFQFDAKQMSGAKKFYVNGPGVFVDASEMSWKAVFQNFERKK